MESPQPDVTLRAVNDAREAVGLEPLTADGWNPVKQLRDRLGRWRDMPDIKARLKVRATTRARLHAERGGRGGTPNPNPMPNPMPNPNIGKPGAPATQRVYAGRTNPLEGRLVNKDEAAKVQAVKDAMTGAVNEWAEAIGWRADRKEHQNGMIYYTLYDEKNHFAGTIERRVLDSGTVKNELFELLESHQGRGLGFDLTKRFEKAYAENGVKKIKLLANIDVGAYAWARAGFDYDWDAGKPGDETANLGDFETRADEVLEGLIDLGQLDPGEADWILSEFEDYMVRMRDPNPENRPTPLELAMLGSDLPFEGEDGEETWFGKVLLTGEDAPSWHGVKNVPSKEPEEPKARIYAPRETAPPREGWTEALPLLGELPQGLDGFRPVQEPGQPIKLTKTKNFVDPSQNEPDKPLEYVYRSISEEEWEEIKKNGYIQSDFRMNLAEGEGTVTKAYDPSWYLPHQAGMRGRTIRIKYDPEDGWWLDTDGYIKNNNPVSADRIDAVTDWTYGTGTGSEPLDQAVESIASNISNPITRKLQKASAEADRAGDWQRDDEIRAAVSKLSDMDSKFRRKLRDEEFNRRPPTREETEEFLAELERELPDWAVAEDIAGARKLLAAQDAQRGAQPTKPEQTPDAVEAAARADYRQRLDAATASLPDDPADLDEEHLPAMLEVGKIMDEELERRIQARGPEDADMVEAQIKQLELEDAEKELVEANLAVQERTNSLQDDAVETYYQYNEGNPDTQFDSFAEAVAAVDDPDVSDDRRAAAQKVLSAYEAGVEFDEDLAGWENQIKRQRNKITRLKAEVDAAEGGHMVPGSPAHGRAQREEAIAMLEEMREMGGQVPIDLNVSPEQAKSMLAALDAANIAYPADWHAALQAAMNGERYELSMGERGYQDWANKELMLSPGRDGLSEGGGNPFNAVAVHEIGHGMENALVQLQRLQLAFSKHRSPRDKEQSRSIYGDDREMGFADQFADPYSGKVYAGRGGVNWEMFTVGIESLMAGMDGFIRAEDLGGFDSEYRAFILAMLARG